MGRGAETMFGMQPGITGIEGFEEMEKAEARKLQPFFIRAFFNQAFQQLGGELRAQRVELEADGAFERGADAGISGARGREGECEGGEKESGAEEGFHGKIRAGLGNRGT